MLKKRERLTRADFQKTHASGRRFGGSALSLVVAPSTQPKCAVVVSKKTARNATTRNRVRRHVYTALGTIKPSWSNKNVIVFVQHKAVHLTPTQTRKELETLFEAINRPQ